MTVGFAALTFAAEAAGQPWYINLLPLVAILGIIYFLIIRPQQTEQAAKEAMVASLVKDDQVITGSGIHGKVVEVAEGTILLEIADKVRIQLEKSAVVRKIGTEK